MDDTWHGLKRTNVETVLSVFDAFHRRDGDFVFAAYHPDVEWNLESYSPWAEAPVFRGHDGILAFFRLWLEDFEGYEAEARDPLDLGDQVLITVYDRARGRGSGVPIERYHAQVWTFRDGEVVRVQIFDDRERALHALGLTG